MGQHGIISGEYNMREYEMTPRILWSSRVANQSWFIFSDTGKHDSTNQRFREKETQTQFGWFLIL
jgi:hypothetical protein